MGSLDPSVAAFVPRVHFSPVTTSGPFSLTTTRDPCSLVFRLRRAVANPEFVPGIPWSKLNANANVFVPAIPMTTNAFDDAPEYNPYNKRSSSTQSVEPMYGSDDTASESSNVDTDSSGSPACSPSTIDSPELVSEEHARQCAGSDQVASAFSKSVTHQASSLSADATPFTPGLISHHQLNATAVSFTPSACRQWCADARATVFVPGRLVHKTSASRAFSLADNSDSDTLRGVSLSSSEDLTARTCHVDGWVSESIKRGGPLIVDGTAWRTRARLDRLIAERQNTAKNDQSEATGSCACQCESDLQVVRFERAKEGHRAEVSSEPPSQQVLEGPWPEPFAGALDVITNLRPGAFERVNDEHPSTLRLESHGWEVIQLNSEPTKGFRSPMRTHEEVSNESAERGALLAVFAEAFRLEYTDGSDQRAQLQVISLPYSSEQIADGFQRISVLLMPETHHFNWCGNAVFGKSSTKPATSLTILMTKWKHDFRFDEERPLRSQVLIENAFKYIDPVIFTGDQQILHLRGSALENAAIGATAKFYSPHGTGNHNELADDEDVPVEGDLETPVSTPQHVIFLGQTPATLGHCQMVASKYVADNQADSKMELEVRHREMKKYGYQGSPLNPNRDMNGWLAHKERVDDLPHPVRPTVENLNAAELNAMPSTASASCVTIEDFHVQSVDNQHSDAQRITPLVPYEEDLEDWADESEELEAFASSTNSPLLSPECSRSPSLVQDTTPPVSYGDKADSCVEDATASPTDIDELLIKSSERDLCDFAVEEQSGEQAAELFSASPAMEAADLDDLQSVHNIISTEPKEMEPEREIKGVVLPAPVLPVTFAQRILKNPPQIMMKDVAEPRTGAELSSLNSVDSLEIEHEDVVSTVDDNKSSACPVIAGTEQDDSESSRSQPTTLSKGKARATESEEMTSLPASSRLVQKPHRSFVRNKLALLPPKVQQNNPPANNAEDLAKAILRGIDDVPIAPYSLLSKPNISVTQTSVIVLSQFSSAQITTQTYPDQTTENMHSPLELTEYAQALFTGFSGFQSAAESDLGPSGDRNDIEKDEDVAAPVFAQFADSIPAGGRKRLRIVPSGSPAFAECNLAQDAESSSDEEAAPDSVQNGDKRLSAGMTVGSEVDIPTLAKRTRHLEAALNNAITTENDPNRSAIASLSKHLIVNQASSARGRIPRKPVQAIDANVKDKSTDTGDQPLTPRRRPASWLAGLQDALQFTPPHDNSTRPQVPILESTTRYLSRNQSNSDIAVPNQKRKSYIAAEGEGKKAGLLKRAHKRAASLPGLLNRSEGHGVFVDGVTEQDGTASTALRKLEVNKKSILMQAVGMVKGFFLKKQNILIY